MGRRRGGGSRLVAEVSPVFGVALLASDVLLKQVGFSAGRWASTASLQHVLEVTVEVTGSGGCGLESLS